MSEQLNAPPGKYRVIGFDIWEGPYVSYKIGDYDTLDEAKAMADKRHSADEPVCVYDDSTKRPVYEVK